VMDIGFRTTCAEAEVLKMQRFVMMLCMFDFFLFEIGFIALRQVIQKMSLLRSRHLMIEIGCNLGFFFLFSFLE
jgi:hypothetical protein